MTFLSPLMLWGMALAAAPILIHLLHRRRFTVVRWAPMRHLHLTLRRNRRRIQIEQWLLLAVRVLVIVVLISALARPTWDRPDPLAWLTGAEPVWRIVVLDDSASMSLDPGDGPVFERAVTWLGQQLERLPERDRITLMVTSLPEPVAHAIPAGARDDWREALAGLTPTDTASHWPATFARIDQVLSENPQLRAAVLLVTDGRLAGWDQVDPALTGRWARRPVSLTIADLGAEAGGNVAITSLSVPPGPVTPGQPIDLHAELLWTDALSAGDAGPPTTATLRIGEQARTVSLPDLTLDQTVTATFRVTPERAGSLSVSLELPDDVLPPDNARHLVLPVRETVDVLLVDAVTAVDRFDAATGFLELALAVGRPGWRIERQSLEQWEHEAWRQPDLLVIADAPSISPERAARVRQAVEGGMGLMLFPGDQLDPAAWARTLGPAGADLLPALPGTIRELALRGVALTDASDSPLAALARITPGVLARITARRSLTLTPLPTASDAPDQATEAADALTAPRELAVWNDPERTPLAVSRRLGDGAVLLWTVTADRSWSDWPIEPSFVLAMRSAASLLAPGARPVRDGVVGEPIALRATTGEVIAQPRVQPPTQAPPLTLTPARAASPPPAPSFAAPSEPSTWVSPPTRFAGVYELAWTDGHGELRRDRAAFNVAPSESDPRAAPAGQFASWLAPLDVVVIDRNAIGDALAPQAAGLWRPLILALLALLVGEAALATWVGRRR